MKPGSKVNTPCSLVRLEMSSASGPMVPETAFRRVVFPVARFFSSNFVLMRFSDGWFALGSAALHGRTSESREHSLTRARTQGAHEVKARTDSRRARIPPRATETLESVRLRLLQPPHTSCGIYRRARRYPQFSACRYRTDGSWSKLQPADPGQWSSGSRTCCRRCR